MLFWCRIILIVAGIVTLIALGKWTYDTGHDVMMKHYERSMIREKIRAQYIRNESAIQIMQMENKIFEYGQAQGHNVKYGKLEVSNYLSNLHNLQGGSNQTLLAPVTTEYLPEPYKFSDVLQNWQPSKDGILLGKKHELITCPIGENLCHTLFTGNTDGGKTNDERLILIQLLYLQQVCFLCDRNYQRFRIDKKQDCVYDYTLIENQLAHEPIDTPKGTLQLLKYLISELDDRRIQRKKAIVHFKDMYVFIDELPALCADEPDIMEYVGRIVREARQYGIFFVGAAQDVLNKTLNNDNGAIRDNFLTNLYSGGDQTTAKLLLNLQNGEKLDEVGLGKYGAKYIRAKGAGIEKVKARTPLADDLATKLLLGDISPREKLTVVDMFQSEVNLPQVIQPKKSKEPNLAEAIEFSNSIGGAKVRDLQNRFDLSYYQAYETYKKIYSIDQSINQEGDTND
jgi:hypothetical protein